MNPYLITAFVIWVYFSIVFLIASRLSNNSIVDIAWGPGFIVGIWTCYLSSNGMTIVIPILVTLWGLRLFLHIAIRNIGKPEDYRYVQMRANWGNHPYLNAYFKVFILQFILLYIIIFSSLTANSSLQSILLKNIGLTIFIFGLCFETVGDIQLKRFIRTKKPGQIITTGLWKYTRHPNYFGEAVLWWGLYLVSLSYGGLVLGIFSPITITVLVRYISGVPLLENRYKDNPLYDEYKKSTSVFIPLPNFKRS